MSEDIELRPDLDVLDGAIELVSRDGGWCKGTYCQDADGNSVIPGAYSAHDDWVSWQYRPGPDGEPSMQMLPAAEPVSFCLEGAIRYSAVNFSPVAYEMGFFSRACGCGCGDDRNAPLLEQAARLEYLVLSIAAPVRDNRELIDHGLLITLHEYNDRDSTGQEDALLALKQAREYVASNPHWAANPMKPDTP